MGHDIGAFYTFTTVRNPWDRLVSVYTFGLRSTGSIWRKVALEGGSFTGFIDLIGKDGRPCPLTIVQFGRDDTGTIVPEVFKVDALHHLTERLKERYGIEATLPHINVGERKDYRTYYDVAARQRVADIYAADIELFGYSFDDGAERTG